MTSGLLFFYGKDILNGIDHTMTFEQAVRTAILRYEQKFGVRPNVCYVNPKQMHPDQSDGIRFVEAPTILRSHLMLGRESA